MRGSHHMIVMASFNFLPPPGWLRYYWHKTKVWKVLLLLLSHVKLFATSWTTAHQISLSFIISSNLLKLMSIESVMSYNHLILCHPLIFLPSIFPSINVFSNETALHIRWPKYWSFSFSISPSNEYLGLISFKIDWFELCCPRTLKNLFQNYSLKTSILQCLAFFIKVLFSHMYMTTEKNIVLTIWTFFAKWFFNTLSRFVIAFLPGSKCLLISWIQSPSTVILKHKKMKSVTVSIFSPTVLPRSDGTGCHDLRFFNVSRTIW